MSRRVWTLAVSAFTFLVLVAIAVLLPVPYVRLAPGPTFNVIGEYDNRDVIEISGTTTYPTTGALDMTTVRESGGPRGGLTFVQAIGAWFSESDAVVPQELLYDEQVTGDEIRQRQARLFEVSESNAVAAAMGYLGQPVEVTTYVSTVIVGAPADGIIQPGDVVVSIDGVEVAGPTPFVEAIRSAPIGTTFTVEVERDDERETLRVTSAENPDVPERPYIGIELEPFYRADFDITLNLEDIGGPSAGMMFALGIVDKLSPEELTAGRAIAGTGTISPDGTVGPVGGVRQKVLAARGAGAELFLMTPNQCLEVEGRVPEGLTVTPVETLTEAITAIEIWTAGGSVEPCPVRGTSES